MMRVKCSLCEKLETINDDTLVAKRLRNRPIHTYMCVDCQERIKVKTEERIKTGRFSLYQDPATKEKKKKKGKKEQKT
ncbi:YlaI family protein [Bacillus aerius]|nr:YlaI family protein [Bacillus aerius]WMT27947.1 YlaI family protein [Bacillus aerius]